MQKLELMRVYKTKTALVIDDFPDIRATVKRMLNKFGIEDVDTASSGEDAIEKCRKKRYDIIMADYNLGEKKTGQQILEELRFRGLIRYSSLYVMITAETTRDKVYSAIENQPDAYLAKPFAPPALQKRLDALMISKVELADINKAADAGDIPVAITLCKHRIAMDDRYKVPCQKMLGLFYFHSGLYDEAIALYEAVLQERELSWAMIGLGRARLAKDELDEAERIFTSLVEQKSPFLEVYDGLAEVHAKRGKLHEAQSVLEEAIALAPDAILRQKRLGDYSALNDDPERAEKAYRRVVKIGYHSIYEKPENYFDFVHCLNKSAKNSKGADKKRFEEATEVLARAGRRYKTDPALMVQTRFAQAETCIANGKDAQAKEHLDKGEKAYADLTAGHDVPHSVTLEYAKALDMNGDKKRAKSLLEELSKKHPDDPGIQDAIDSCLDEPVSKAGKGKIIEFNKEGKVLFEKKDFVGAVDFFDKALRIYPNHVALNLNMAMALLKAMAEVGQKPNYIKRLKTVLTKLKDLDEGHDYYQLYSNIKQQAQKLNA
jgi:CheY-like chemotaxis protein